MMMNVTVLVMICGSVQSIIVPQEMTSYVYRLQEGVGDEFESLVSFEKLSFVLGCELWEMTLALYFIFT